MTLQGQMYVGLGVWAVLMYCVGVSAVRADRPAIAALVILAASPVLIAALAVVIEHRDLLPLLNLKKQSWSFTLGDTFALTTALMFATLAWRHLPEGGWYRTWWWALLGAGFGLLAGMAFHKWDGGNYRKVGAEALLNSPTKIAHDFVAYPVLFGVIVCVGIPLVMHAFKTQWTSASVGFVVCLGVWALLVVCDGLRGLNPFDLHPAWNAVSFSRL